MADLAYTIGLVATVPPNGAWFVYDSGAASWDDRPLGLFGDELSARRWADETGHGCVVFWPFGREWCEVERG